MVKNARLRLLMTLFGFEQLGSEDAIDTTWVVPSALTSDKLGETLSIIEKFEQAPWVSEDPNDSPEDLLRRVRHTAKDEDEDVRRDAFIDDSEGDDVLEEFMFPDNIRSKSSATNALEQLKEARRKRKNKSEREPLDEDVAEARRKAKQAAALERRRKIKSELYIHDSDEDMDEEESRAFFAREEENRKRQAERVRRAIMLGISDSEVKGKKRKSTGSSDAPEKRRKQDNTDDDDDDDDDDDELLSDEEVDSVEGDLVLSPQHVVDTSDEVMEDTPLSSQSHQADDLSATLKEKALKELRQPPAETKPASKVNSGSADEDEEEDEDDEVPVASNRRARYRAGFIVDSDDE
jgi:replication fork protection complex subunit Tof1/Swi1